jgi:hypothetical protein
LDPISSPALNGMTVNPAGAAHGRQASDQMAFQSVYREALAISPAARPLDMRSDLRALGQNFRDLERGLEVDRAGLLRALMPPPSSANSVNGEYRAQSAVGRDTGDRGNFGDNGSRMLARDSDRIGGGPPRPLFSDRASDAAPPVIQAALGLASEAKTNRINFASEISGISSRIENVMGTIKERIADTSPKTPEESMKHNSEIQGLVREGDNLNSERSMMMTLHLAAHQESRTRMLSGFEYLVGMTKKINEIFNQLKQGS